MNKRISLISVSLGLIISACAPSINPALKSSVDKQVASFRQQSAEYPAAQHPATQDPATSDAPSMRAGQWAIYISRDKEGRPTVFQQKLLKAEGDVYTVETLVTNYYERDLIQMQMRITNIHDLDGIEIIAMKDKNADGKVHVYDETELRLANDLMDKDTGFIFFKMGKVVGTEDVSTPAGTFKGAEKRVATVKVFAIPMKVEQWHHDAAPFAGVVKSGRPGKDSGTMELVRFGMQGAKSAF